MPTRRSVVRVRDGAGADDRPRAQIARVRRVGDQLVETEAHFPGVRMSERAAVPGHSHGQVDSAGLPGGAELVGGHGDGAETRGGFCVNPAKARLHLRNRVRSQARVVREHHELHVLERSRGRGSHRHTIDDDGELCFEIDAVRFRWQRHVFARAKEVVRSALVHQRPRLRAVEEVVLEGPLHERAVAVKGRPVEPLPGARKRRAEIGTRKLELSRDRTVVERLGKAPANAARFGPTIREQPAVCRQRSSPSRLAADRWKRRRAPRLENRRARWQVSWRGDHSNCLRIVRRNAE